MSDPQIAYALMYFGAIVIGAVSGFQINRTGDTKMTAPVYAALFSFYVGSLMLVPTVVVEKGFTYFVYASVTVFFGAVWVAIATGVWYFFFKWFGRLFVRWLR